MAHLTISKVHLGLYDDAAYLGRQVIKLRIKTFGCLQLDTLDAMENLAATLHDPLEAEKLYHEVLSSRRKVLGEKHADTMVALGNLAHVTRNLGRNEEAEALQSRTVKLNEENFGRDHPNTLAATHNLALTWYYALKRCDEETSLMKEVVEMGMDVLGDEHYLVIKRSVDFLKHWREEQRRDSGVFVVELADENDNNTLQS